jgi:tRNA A37 threonylcarbamoyladenosine dehydratase
MPEHPGERRPQGTISYMPALFGLHCAAVVIRDLVRPIPFIRRGDTPKKGR